MVGRLVRVVTLTVGARAFFLCLCCQGFCKVAKAAIEGVRSKQALRGRIPPLEQPRLQIVTSVRAG